MQYCPNCHTYMADTHTACPSCGQGFHRAVTGATQRLRAVDELRCLRCQTPMEPGFLLELDFQGKRRRIRWVDGIPKRSRWFGDVSTSDRRVLGVQTYRCTRCGYLESYAHEDDIDKL